MQAAPWLLQEFGSFLTKNTTQGRPETFGTFNFSCDATYKE